MLEQFYGCYVTIWIPDYNSSELVWSAVHACGIFWSYSLKFFNLLMKINIVFARSFRTMLLQEHYFHACINVILHEPVLGWGDSGFYMIFQEVIKSHQWIAIFHLPLYARNP